MGRPRGRRGARDGRRQLPPAHQGVPVGRRRLRGRAPKNLGEKSGRRRRLGAARRLRPDGRRVGRIGRRQHHLGDPRARIRSASSSPSCSSSSSRRSTCAACASRRRSFAIPTYLFIGVGLRHDRRRARHARRSATRRSPSRRTTPCRPSPSRRRRSSCCCCARSRAAARALTGVEAVANGVPAFRMPKVRNAQMTLVLMGGIAIVLFAGLTALALISQGALRREPVPPASASTASTPRAAAQPHGAGRRGDVRRQRSILVLRHPGRDRAACCCSRRTPRSTDSRCSARCSPATATRRRRSTPAATGSSSRTA